MQEKNYRTDKIYSGNISKLMEQAAVDFGLGKIVSFDKIEIGYEDNNYELKTSSGNYLVKIFGNYRNLEECRRYVELLEKVDEAGVQIPKLFKFKGNALYQRDDANLVIFQFIDGQSFYQLGVSPTEKEAEEILHQAAKINQIDFKPKFIYDDWSMADVEKEYAFAEKYLKPVELQAVKPIVAEFKKIDRDSLPHAFVHGDLIATNVMKSQEGKIYLLDFACANYYPRIVELAILSGNLLRSFDLDWIIKIYEKYNRLESREKELLPLFKKMAFAMGVISAVRERDVYGNNSKENEYWLEQGLTGLNIEEVL